MVTYGYYIMGLGIVALIAAAVMIAFRLGYHKSTLMLGGCLIGLGASLVYIGPWLAWIFAGAVGLMLFAFVVIVVRNWARWIGWLERKTDLEVDGIPNAEQYKDADK